MGALFGLVNTKVSDVDFKRVSFLHSLFGHVAPSYCGHHTPKKLIPPALPTQQIREEIRVGSPTYLFSLFFNLSFAVRRTIKQAQERAASMASVHVASHRFQLA